MKDFCDKVQAWRRASNTEFEKSFYKLILKSLYGRMLMNTRKFCDSYLVSDTNEYLRMKESNRIKFRGKLSDNLLFVAMEKSVQTLSNPIAIGVAILGISKWILLSYWYRMKDLLGDNLRNGGVDTDSTHDVIYNVDFHQMIADSLKEKSRDDRKIWKRIRRSLRPLFPM